MLLLKKRSLHFLFAALKLSLISRARPCVTVFITSQTTCTISVLRKKKKKLVILFVARFLRLSCLYLNVYLLMKMNGPCATYRPQSPTVADNIMRARKNLQGYDMTFATLSFTLLSQHARNNQTKYLF